MGVLRSLLHGLRDWRRSDEIDRELADELEHFYAEAVDDLVRHGAAPEHARRHVRLTYGDALGAREDVRASLWESAAQDLVADLRLGLRRLRRSPGFTATVAAVLGLGIGAATVIVSVVRPVVFDGLGYPDANQLIAIEDRSDAGQPLAVTFGSFLEFERRTTRFDALAVHGVWQPTLTGGAEPERLEGERVSADFFEVLGVPPRIGPGLDPDEAHEGGAKQVVLSHDLWTRRFDADPRVLERTLELDGVPYAVVGVMPPDFRSVLRTESRIWTHLHYGSATDPNGPEWGHHLGMIGRLGMGVTIESGRAELTEVAARPIPDFPRPNWAAMDDGLIVTPLRSFATADGRGTGLILLGAAGLLLIIACVNLAILLVARGLRRGGELAVRTALGAGRGRLIRQLTVESLLLAGLGGALGLAIAVIGTDSILTGLPASLRGLGSSGLDAGTLAFALVVVLVVGVAGGVIPALAASRGASAAGGVRGSAPAHRVARNLIVSEVALAVVLLVGAGLLTRTMHNLLAEPYGIDPGSTWVMQVRATSVPGGDVEVNQFWDRSLDAVREVPGVRSVATTTQLPLSGDFDAYGVAMQTPGRTGEVAGTAFRYAVSPDYHDLMGIPIRHGRALGRADQADAQPVAVVSASLARGLFGDADPLGREIRLGVGGAAYSIVGVAGDVRQQSLATDVTDAVYVTTHQWRWADRIRWVAVEVADPGVIDSVKRAIWSVNPDQSIGKVETLDRVVRRSEAHRRFVLALVGIFAALAVVLSALGLYGVISAQVADRRREMGIRAALGARQPELVGLVLRRGLGLSLIGIGLGLALAMLASRALASLLFGVTGLDPLTYAAVSGLFLTVAALACWIPARRAAKADPLRSLAAE